MASGKVNDNNKPIRKLMEPIVVKVRELDSLLESDSNFTFNNSEDEYEFRCIIEGTYVSLLELCNTDLAQSCVQVLKQKLTSTLEEFYRAFGYAENQCCSPVTNKKMKQLAVNLRDSLQELLSLREHMVVKKLKESIVQCQNSLKDVEQIDDDSVLQKLKVFFDTTKDCTQTFKSQGFDLLNEKSQKDVILCINQIMKSISFLVRYDVLSNKVTKNYLTKRIHWCLAELDRLIPLAAQNGTLSKQTEQDEEHDSSGEFIKTMDAVLAMLDSFCEETDSYRDLCVRVKPVIDEMLSCAMAIAQVSILTDSHNITASSHKVLRAYENLNEEAYLPSVNLVACKLCMRSLGDALESLEQKVNTALLRLVLEVFSAPNMPLKKLMQACCLVGPAAGRLPQDLDGFILDFDLHIDRIMQIGMFAMACSTSQTTSVASIADVAGVRKMRSSLASLESLAAEIVPAVTSRYMDPKGPVNKSHLGFLTHHWQIELQQLEYLLDYIIDPAAFCEVTLSEIEHLAATAKSYLKNSKPIPQVTVQKFVSKAMKLLNHLKISTPEMEPFTSGLNIPLMIQDYEKACRECQAAVNFLLPSGNEDPVPGSLLRVVKRCELVVCQVKKLLPAILELVNYSNPEEASAVKKSGDTVLFPSRIEDLPLDISPTKTQTGDKKEEQEVYSMKQLLPYLVKGQQIRQEKSILYQTPKANKTIKRKLKYNSPSPRNSHRSFSTTNISNAAVCHTEAQPDDTMELEITNILENLTSLSDTLSCLHI